MNKVNMIFKPQHTPEPNRYRLFSVLDTLAIALACWYGKKKIKPTEFPDPQALLSRCPWKPPPGRADLLLSHLPKLGRSSPLC